MAVPAWFRQTLETELSSLVTLSGPQIAQLYEHYVLLDRWNKKINLTTVEPGPQMVIRHYCESLFFSSHLEANRVAIADIGSGAGFPGIPLAILKPECKVTLVESHQRKAVFLTEATRTLENVVIVAQRAEDVTTGFDWLVARAVRPMDVITLIPRLALNVGLMLGEDDFLHIKAAKHVAWSEPVRLPWGDRRICVFGEGST
jgi:16S rRNA (guanine(527)-N(7))-methyltransferase RsmG